MAHDDDMTNKSGNRPFQEILDVNMSRRTIMKGGLASAAAFFAASNPVIAGGLKSHRFDNLIGFEPVPLSDGNGPVPSISADYEYQTLIPWGDPLEPGGPSYDGDPQTRPTADEQAEMIGIGHDGMWYFPIKNEHAHRCGWDQDWNEWNDLDDWHSNNRRHRHGNHHGMLCINHEFGRNSHVLNKAQPENLEDVRLSQHAHGVAVVELKKHFDEWSQVESERARRIHVNSAMVFSGPAADSDLLNTPAGNAALGTVNNCSSGYTPWGTYLTCEENFNGYFGATNADNTWVATPAQERYGFSNTGFGYGWEKFDSRFDLSNPDYANEENRFGWVVEIDPMDPTQTPIKRTALGRIKHEGATVTVGQGGRIVCYLGDDQRFDYIYKFVSDDNWRKMLRQGKSPLDHGKLYVARFNDDGTGDWLELTIDNPILAANFDDQAEVLVYTRMAADLLEATPMDRPEWISVAPNRDVYCTLTNNSQRTEANAANPLTPNSDGHIIRWRDSHHHVGTSFTWDIFIFAQDTHGTEQSFSDPDGIWIDPDGRLFIETDGGQKDGLNNQCLVVDTRSDNPAAEMKRLFTGVTKDEITGLTTTPDRRTLFINTQHPGNGDPSLTNFPAATDGETIPRDCTFVITRKDGGIVGS